MAQRYILQSAPQSNQRFTPANTAPRSQSVPQQKQDAPSDLSVIFQNASRFGQIGKQLAESFDPGSGRNFNPWLQAASGAAGAATLAEGIDQGDPIKSIGGISQAAPFVGSTIEKLGRYLDVNLGGASQAGGVLGQLAGPLSLYNSIANSNPAGFFRGLGGTISLGGSIANLLNTSGVLPNTVGPTLQAFGTGMGSGVPNLTSGLSGNITSLGGLAGAGLSLAGGLSGNEDLALTGNLVGSAASLYGLGSGLASVLGGGAAGAGAGVGAGAGAAAAGAAASAGGVGAGSAAAGLSAGALGGIAGGVLAIPSIAAFLVNYLDPPTHYEKTRRSAEAEAKAHLAALNDYYGKTIQSRDPRMLWTALTARLGNTGALRSQFQPTAEDAKTLGISERVDWSALSPEQFTSVMQWISQDPARLSRIVGSGDVPYLEQTRAEDYAGQMTDYARNLVAQFLGLPYYFVEPEHRSRPGIVRNQWGAIAAAPDAETLELLRKKEQSYLDARNAWAAKNPNVTLENWSPTFLGKEDDWTTWRQQQDPWHGNPGFGAG